MSNRPKLNVTSLADLTQIDIEAPAHPFSYADKIYLEIMTMFDKDLSQSKILIGVNLGELPRLDEAKLFSDLGAQGYKPKIVTWGGKSSLYSGLLVERSDTGPVITAPQSLLGP